jgi:hypothetical protein
VPVLVVLAVLKSSNVPQDDYCSLPSFFYPSDEVALSRERSQYVLKRKILSHHNTNAMLTGGISFDKNELVERNTL